MNQITQTLTLFVYQLLDRLKQDSPKLWAVAQLSLWGTFLLLSSNYVNIPYEEVILVVIGGLISGVGSRTSKKLQEIKKVDPDKFKQGVEDKMKQIEDRKEELSFKKPKEKLEEPEQHKEELKIEKRFLPKGQYIEEITKKNQIVLHHTAGGNSNGTIQHWLSSKDRTGTHFIIERDGTIIQTVPTECWLYHLYVGAPLNKVPREFKKKDKELNQKSIGIELCNYGQLKKKGDKYYTIYNNEINKDRVYTLDKTFRGQEYFELYTLEQIESLRKLLLQLIKDNNIKLNQNYLDIFDINLEALSGKSGIFAHVSYRTTDKWDVYPNKELIQMLNNLYVSE